MYTYSLAKLLSDDVAVDPTTRDLNFDLITRDAATSDYSILHIHLVPY